MIHAYKCSICTPLITRHTSRRQSNSCQTLISMSGVMAVHFFPLQMHPVVWNWWYQCLMLLEDGGSLLNCRRNARWTETTDSCFTNCSTQNAFYFGVAIIAVLRHRPREKRGVGLRMSRKLEHLLFRSMWGNLLQNALSKPWWQIETAPLILIHPVYLLDAVYIQMTALSWNSYCVMWCVPMCAVWLSHFLLVPKNESVSVLN